jgi:peptidoglycan hydrolase CwlO-like protein
MNMKTIHALLAFLLLFSTSPAYAENSNDTKEAQSLLQRGLTIYEIDRELERLNEQDKKISDQIQNTGIDMVKQDKNVQASRKHAGRVLRAYYSGDRDNIWLLIFTVRSFTDALHTFEYLNMIVQNDHRALNTFTASYQQLQKLKTQLEASRIELQKTKDNYLKQRVRLVELQAELDKQLAVSVQGKVVEAQIKVLNEEWKLKGLPLFRQFFEKLSIAFFDLPELLTKDAGKNLVFEGSKGAVFTLTDQSLNSFLQSKNELFTQLSFRFTEGKVLVSGKKDDADIQIKGNFLLIPGQDMNEVRFTVDQLVFNGFQLPDTTIASLQEEFGLGFFPKKSAKVEVTEVLNQEGKLVIRLKF